MVTNKHVGITVSIDDGQKIRRGYEYLYLKRRYPQAVRKVGFVPLLLFPEISPDEALELCDGVVISGGEDLPNSRALLNTSTFPNLEMRDRFEWEMNLINAFVGASKPILGICYGMQLLNLHFGGTLYRDIHAEIRQPLNHGGRLDVTHHSVKTTAGSYLSRVLGGEAVVSSAHHQAVKQVAEGFSVTAQAPDGVVEAIESDFALAVEWHPESDETSDAIYNYLVENIA